ncbi:Putative RecA protein, degenerate [Anaplasma phagocytophilum]|uniref:Putative RecA protein, degenerate n=1 Tax=Anaplasma phagocytophilum TaxID=948 RepID=A0A098EI19_ANAPH|nr:Putative RecA protein, degenerate [Anaplasma phagocytophilum]
MDSVATLTPHAKIKGEMACFIVFRDIESILRGWFMAIQFSDL